MGQPRGDRRLEPEALGGELRQQRARRSAKGRSAAADEEPEHGAANGFAQGGAVIGRPAGPVHERVVGPEKVL